MNLQQISQLGRLAVMEKTGSLSPFAQRGQTDLMLLNQLSQSFAPVMTAPQQQMRSGFETLPGFSDPGIMGLIMNQFVAPRLTTIMGKQGLVPGGLSSQNILDYQDAQRFHKVAQLGRLAAMEKMAEPDHLVGVDTTSLPSDYPGSTMRSVIDRKSVSLADVLPKGYRAGAQQHAKAWRASNPRVEEGYSQDISDKAIDRKVDVVSLRPQGFKKNYGAGGNLPVDQVGGYYDPNLHGGQIVLPENPNPVTLGHELTHGTQEYNMSPWGEWPPSYRGDIETALAEASSPTLRENPARYAKYYGSQHESEAYLATIKRDYYEATGKHVTNAQEAQEALKWNREQPYTSRVALRDEGLSREQILGPDGKMGTEDDRTNPDGSPILNANTQPLTPEAEAAKENWMKHWAEKMPGLVRTGSPNQFDKAAQLGRLAAMEKVGGKRNKGDITSFSTSSPSASSFLPNRPPPTSPVLKKLKADPKTNLAMGAVQKSLHGAGPRGALRAPISEQGTMPPTYRATTPWPKRLYQQRHGTRKLTPESNSRGNKDRSAWALPGTGIGNVPKRPRGQSATDIDDVVNYWATRNHEGEHAFNQPVRPPRFLTNPEATEIRRDTFEVGPSIGDIIFRGEQFAREEGKPLQHTVKLPGGVEHDINWMRRQAQKYNYWGSDGQDPRSMHDLIFNTTAGQQWYKRMVEGEASGLYP